MSSKKEKRVWDRIFGDPKKCKWYLYGLCLKRRNKIKSIEEIPVCSEKVCNEYEEEDTTINQKMEKIIGELIRKKRL